MEKVWRILKKRINVGLINYSNEYIKCVSKRNFISQKNI